MKQEIYYRESWLWFIIFIPIIIGAYYFKSFILMTWLATGLFLACVIYNASRPKRVSQMMKESGK